MDEFGVDGMRKKLVTIECSQRLQCPLAFRKNEVVIMADRVGKLCCYDFGTQEIKELQVHKHLRNYFFVVIYMSSLDSVRGGNKLDTG